MRSPCGRSGVNLTFSLSLSVSPSPPPLPPCIRRSLAPPPTDPGPSAFSSLLDGGYRRSGRALIVRGSLYAAVPFQTDASLWRRSHHGGRVRPTAPWGPAATVNNKKISRYQQKSHLFGERNRKAGNCNWTRNNTINHSCEGYRNRSCCCCLDRADC